MANTLRTKICLVFSLLGLALLLSIFSTPQKAAAAGEEYMWTTNATIRVSGGDLSAPGELTFVSEQNGQNIFAGTLQHALGCTINMQVAWALGASEFTTSVSQDGSGGSCSQAVKQSYDNQTITNIVEEDPDTAGVNEANVAVRFWGPDAIPKEGGAGAYIASPQTIDFEIKRSGSVVFSGTGRKTATDQTIGTSVYTMGYYEIDTGGNLGNLPALQRTGAYELCPTSTTLIACIPFTVPAGYVSGAVLEINNKPTPKATGSCNKDAGGIGWVICPMSSTLIKGAIGLDEEILGLVLINACRIFQNNPTMDARCSANVDNGKEKEASAAMYTAHKVFRNLAYVMLVGIGLTMVISQIFGFDALDAYAIRKLILKLIMATIAIPFLWPILRTLTLIANDSANAVSELIYAPFMDIGRTSGAGDITGALLAGLLSAGSVLGAGLYLVIGGWGVVLALLGTIFLTALQAFVVLVARDLVFSGIVIASAPLVAAAAFEPFKAAFTFGWNTIRAIWLSIPAVAGVLALSKVGAAIALLTHPNLGYVFALLVIAVGYSQFWKVLKSADKVSGMIDAGLDKVTAGAKQGLSKYRSNTVKQNFREAAQGRRWAGANGLTQRLNRMTNYIGAAASTGRLGIGRNGRAKIQARRLEQEDVGAGEAGKSESWKAISQEDALLSAGRSARGMPAIQRELERRHQAGEIQRYAGIDDRERARRIAKDAAVTYRAQQEMGAAFDGESIVAEAATASGFGSRTGSAEMLRAITVAAGGDRNQQAQLIVRAKKAAGDANRPELGATRLGVQLETADRLADGTYTDEQASAAIMDAVLNQKNAGVVVQMRPESIPQVTEALQRRVQTGVGRLQAAYSIPAGTAGREAAIRKAQTEFEEDMAYGAALIDYGSSAAPEIGRALADGFHLKPVDANPATMGAGAPPGAQEELEAFLGMRRPEVQVEYDPATGNPRIDPVTGQPVRTVTYGAREPLTQRLLQEHLEARPGFMAMRRTYRSGFEAEGAARAPAGAPAPGAIAGPP